MADMIKWSVRLKETVWAGERIGRLFGGEGFGEVYLFSKSGDLWRESGFPMENGATPLIKYIDVGAPMSVQVHPRGDRGKNELWIVDEVSDHAAVYVGFDRDTSEEEVLEGCENGTLLSLLRRFSVAKGDIFWIPGGTVHCAEGVSFFEVQNERDVTFRLYDHGRGRTLQRDDALRSLEMTKTSSFSVRKSEAEISSLFPFDVTLSRGNGVFFENVDSPCVYTMLSENTSFCGAESTFGASFFVSDKRAIRGRGPYLKIERKSLCETGKEQGFIL